MAEPTKNIDDIPEPVLEMIESGLEALEKEEGGHKVDIREDFPGLLDDIDDEE